MSTWFIDIKVFSSDNAKFVKELCVMNVNNILHPTHYVFYEQTPWSSLTEKSRLDNDYLTKHFHGLGWVEGKDVFCNACLNESWVKYKDDLFYVVDSINGDKINTVKSIFPYLRITNYYMLFTHVPANIACPWRPHGDFCAYKQCLVGCLHYLKND